MQNYIKLLCFPFAGAFSTIYVNWFKNINHRQIELVPVELAGKNKRVLEPMIDSIEATIYDLLPRLLSHFQTPYALLGHSLGCLIIYELIQKIVKNHYNIPKHIFLSGSVPPHLKKTKTFIHLLPDKEFLVEIVKIGGMSKEFLNNKELQKIFLPILRADYKMFETYFPQPDKFNFPCDITVLAGNKDHLASSEMAKHWLNYTTKNAQFIVYEGNHFFIKDNRKSITCLLNQVLSL